MDDPECRHLILLEQLQPLHTQLDKHVMCLRYVDMFAVDYSTHGESPRVRPVCEGDAHLGGQTRALDPNNNAE